ALRADVTDADAEDRAAWLGRRRLLVAAGSTQDTEARLRLLVLVLLHVDRACVPRRRHGRRDHAMRIGRGLGLRRCGGAMSRRRGLFLVLDDDLAGGLELRLGLRAQRGL